MEKTKTGEGRKYSNLGIIFAFLSLIVLPIVFGPIAVILGVMGYFKNDTERGIIAIILGVVLSVISVVIGMFFMMSI